MTLYRWQATITDEAGNVLPGALVEVRSEANGLLASLYEDKAGMVPISGLAADDFGLAGFFVAAGFYRVTARYGNLVIEAGDLNIGAMNASVYDPSGVEADVYSAVNHTFITAGTGLASDTTQGALAELAGGFGRYAVQRNIAGTTDTLGLTDRGGLVRSANGSATTITVPAQASVSWLDGTIIDVVWYGAGQPTFAADSGVTIRSAASHLKIASRYGKAQLVRLAEDEWLLSGSLSA